MPHRSRNGFAWKGAMAGALFVFIQGCVTQVQGPMTPELLASLPARLASGDIRLNCEIACAGAWSAARKKASGFNEQGLWLDLAAEVVRVGHQSDLAYFYLGRAAEGLRQPSAAITYYKLALASPQKCESMFSHCEGVDVKRDATLGLDRLLPPGQRPSESVPKPANLPTEMPNAPT